MKKTVIILTMIFVSISVHAQCYWSGYYVKFFMTTVDGQYGESYIFVSSCDLNIDSLRNTEHLKRAFARSSYDGDNEYTTLTYFQNRMIYQYQRSFDSDFSLEEKIPIYYLLNKVKISLEDIKWIEILELKRDASFIQISSELQLSDNAWIGQTPVKQVEFSSNWGFICSHQIFIHENSENIDDVIRKLELKQKELDEKEDRDIRDNTEEIDGEIWEIIKKLQGEKVVVISECTD